MADIHVRTMMGLGDCIYFRPILKTIPPYNIVLHTSWPQVFYDIPVKRIHLQKTMLHSQKDNYDELITDYPPNPQDYYHIQLSYYLKDKGILETFFNQTCGFQPKEVNQDFKATPKQMMIALDYIGQITKPICLIRPNTQRPEWFSWARSPKNEYIQHFINLYKDKFHFISIANIKPHHEFYEDKPIGCDQYIEKPTYDLTIGLFALAEMVVCGPSFWLALAPAMNVNCICIFGAAEQPDRVHDKRIQRASLKMIVPSPFDDCHHSLKGRFKEIPIHRLEREFQQHVERVQDD